MSKGISRGDGHSDGERSASVTHQSAAQAELWLGRHDRGLSAEEAREFAAWRATSPGNAVEFDQLAAAWNAADIVKADDGLASLTRQIDLDTRRAHHLRATRRIRLAWAGGLAAAAAIVGIALQPRRDVQPPTAGIPTVVVATAPTAVQMTVQEVPSTARRLTLPDGSVAELREDSEVQPRYSATERRVTLVRGEAHFSVEKDAGRPFIVEASGLAVRAVGTAFNVRLDPASVEVLVTEGTISLHSHGAESRSPVEAPPKTAPLVTAGQRVVVENTTTDISRAGLVIEQVLPAAIEQALQWQGTRLVLRRAPLADAIAAFNRHGHGRVELGDDALRSRQISGTFRAQNFEAFVRLLEQAAEVRVERRTDGVVVLHPAR